MASKIVSVVTGGSNSHQTSSAEINGIATDFISQGVVGAVSNTSGVAPATGAFAVNAIGTPNMSVRVTNGVAYVTATPTGGTSQTFRVTMDATEDVTIAANATGGTRYDWIYIKLDADKLVNPAVDASDVATLVSSRSTSASTDNGTPPTYGYAIAVVTVSNGATSITNGNITDSRIRTGANSVPSTALVNAKSLYNPYKFFAYHNTTQSLGSSAQISFNTEVFDTNNNFSSSTYTVPVDGFYCFQAQMYISGGTGVFTSVALYKNGAISHVGSSVVPTAGDSSYALNTIIQCSAGDTIKIYHNNSTTQTVYGQSGVPYYTYFSGFLVSTT